jgi:hypothetical protein
MATELPPDDQIEKDLSSPDTPVSETPTTSAASSIPDDDQIAKDLGGDLTPKPQPVSLEMPEDRKIEADLGKIPRPSADKIITPAAPLTKDAYDVFEKDITEFLPFTPGVMQIDDLRQVYQSANRIKSGKAKAEDGDVDYQVVKSFLEDQAKAAQPSTFGYKFWNTLLKVPGFAAELWLTRGLFKGVQAPVSEVMLNLAEKAAAGAVEKSAVRVGAKVVGTVAGSAAQAAVAKAPDVVGGTMERQLPTMEFSPDEKGQIQLLAQNPNDGFFTSLAKSYGDQFVEVFTEHAGEGISALLSKVPGAQRLATLKEAVIAKWLGTHKGKTVQDLMSKVAKDASWDGIIAEMGEEQLGDLMKWGLGISDGYQQHIQSLSDLGAEAAAFAVPGAVSLAGQKGAAEYEGRQRAQRKAQLEQERQSPERKEALNARARDIEAQSLTDSIMDAGNNRPQAPAPLEGLAPNTPGAQSPAAPAAPSITSPEAPAPAGDLPPAAPATPPSSPANVDDLQRALGEAMQNGQYDEMKRLINQLPPPEQVRGKTGLISMLQGANVSLHGWSLPAANGSIPLWAYIAKANGAEPRAEDLASTAAEMQHSLANDPIYKSASTAPVNQPTEAQKAAGNYQKRKLDFQGLPISIENEQGSTREGTDREGKPWSVTMPAAYGYIRRTAGADSKPGKPEQVDVYVGPNAQSQNVFVIDQQDHESRKFDEHKTFVGFDSLNDVLQAYQAAFSDGKGMQRIKGVASMTMDEFKDWLKKGDTKKEVELEAKRRENEAPAPEQNTFRTQTAPMPGRPVVKARGYWDVIDASQVPELGSIGEFQTRDRYGKHSKEQIHDIAAKLDPDLAGDSPIVTFGAPVMDEEGNRLAGYGRLAGYALAYHANNEPSKAYKKWVVETSNKLGLGDKAAGMEKPILIRRATEFTGGNKTLFADLSNAEAGLEYTPSELARMDAKLIMDNNLLDNLHFDEDGNINKDFKDAFYNRLLNKTGLRSANGVYDPKIVGRINTAILTALLLRGENEQVTFLIRSIAENGSALGIMPQINGLVEAAPSLLRVATLAPDYDIAQPLARALLDFVEYRRQVDRGIVKKVGEFMDQLDLFAMNRSAESGLILEALGERRSYKAVGEFFSRYADLAVNQASQDTGTVDMFGTVAKQTTNELLEKTRNEETRRLAQNVTRNGSGGSQTETGNANAAATGGSSQTAGGTETQAQGGALTGSLPAIAVPPNFERALSLSIETDRKTGKEFKSDGNSVFGGNMTERPNLAAVTSGKNVFHETGVKQASQIFAKLERPFSMSWTGLYVTDNPDLALGQSAKGVLIEMDATRINGFIHQKPGATEHTGREFNVDRSVKGSLVSLTFAKQRDLEAFQKQFPKSFDWDNAQQTERGIRVMRAVPTSGSLPAIASDADNWERNWDSDDAEESVYKIVSKYIKRQSRQSGSFNSKADVESGIATARSIGGAEMDAQSFMERGLPHRAADDIASEFVMEIGSLSRKEAQSITPEGVAQILAQVSESGEAANYQGISPNQILLSDKEALVDLAASIREAATSSLPAVGWDSVDTETPDTQPVIKATSWAEVLQHADGNLNTVLSHLERTTKVGFYKILARTLQRLNPSTQIRLMTLDQYNHMAGTQYGPLVQGAFDLGLNMIAIFTESQSNPEWIIMHEAVHAVTSARLRLDPKFAEQAKGLLEYAKAQMGESDAYGLSNEMEFVAEAFSNPSFQAELKKVDAKAESLWQKFVNLVKKALGLRRANLLEQVIDVATPKFQDHEEAIQDLHKVEGETSMPLLAENLDTARKGLETAKLRGTAAEETEARGMSAQVTFIRRKIEEHTPTGVEDDILAAAMKKIGYDDIFATSEMLNGIVDPEELANGLERLSDSPLLGTYKKEAGMRFKIAKTQLQGVIREHEALLEEVLSKEFQARMQKANEEAAEASYLQLAQKYFDADVARLITQLKELAEAEMRTQGQAEGVYGQLKANMTKSGFSEAVKAAVGQMVRVLSRNEQNFDFFQFYSPTFSVEQLIDTYERLQTEGRPETIIVRWAAELLHRSKDITRNLLAIEALRQNEKVREHYDKLVVTIFDEWKQSPGKTSKKIIKAVSRMATDAERARVAFNAIHAEFASVARNLDVLETAAETARAFLADPETVAYERIAYEGVLQERPKESFDQDPDALRLANGISLPDGTTTEGIVLDGDIQQFTNTVATLTGAAQKIQDWLEANPDKAEAAYWREMLNTIDYVLLSSRVLSPAKTRAPLRQPGPWGMLKYFADDLGSREGGRFKVALEGFKRAEDMAKGLFFENTAKLTNTMVAAAKSHGYKGKTAYTSWYNDVGRALMDSWQNPEGGLEVGQKIMGKAITREDMALVKLMADLAKQGFTIVQKDVVRGREKITQPIWFKTDLGRTGVKMHVQSTTITRYTIPRTFDNMALQFIETWARTPEQGKLKLLDTYFERIVMSHLRDRSNTFFDGLSPHEEAYRAIADSIDEKGLPLAHRNLNWLINQITQIESPNDGESPEQQQQRIATEVIGEFDTMFKRVNEYIEREDADVKIETKEQRSSFTKARGAKLAGYWLYNTGWKDSNAFAHFVHAIHGYFYTRAAEALTRVQEDLTRMAQDLQTKMMVISAEQRLPLDKAKQKAVDSQAALVEKGQTFDDYRELQRKIQQAKSLADNFAAVYGDEGRDTSLQFGKWKRVIQTTGLSVLVSELTGLRNIGFGWIKQGRMLNKLQGTIFTGYPKAFYQSWIRTVAPLTLSAAVSAVKVPGALAKGVYQAASGRYQGKSGLERGPAAAIGRFLEPVLTELTHTMFERMDLNREMFARGVLPKAYAADDFIAKVQNLTEGGVVRETPLYTSAWGNLGWGTLQVYDAMILTTVGRPLFPRAFDIALNHAGVLGAFDSIDMLEKQLRRVHATYQGKNRFDFGNLKNPVNALAPKEVFGGWFGGARTMNDMVHLTHWFETGGIPFQEAAMRFLKKLENGKTDARLLEEDEKWLLAESFVEELNKGTALNRPMQLKKGGIWDIVAPLQGWSVAEFRTYVKHFSRAVDPNSSQVILWMALGMLFVAPALAAGAGGDVLNEWMARLLYKAIRGEERATRQPWERQGTKSQAIGWAISVANPIPFIQSVVNTMLNDMPNRASSDPVLFLQSKAIDVAKYAGGVVKTGDITYGLPRLVKSFLPLSSVFINRLDSVDGSLEALDARRLMTRYGPQDLLKDKSGGGAAEATALTPYGDRMLNAAMHGDDAEFMREYQKAVKVATELGYANPEKTVKQMFASRNPYDRAFKHKLDPEQRTDFLNKLNPEERTLVEDVENRFRHAAGLVGAPANYDKDDRYQNAPGGGFGGAGASGSFGSTGGAAGGAAAVAGTTAALRSLGGAKGRSKGLSRGLARRSRSTTLRRGSAKLSRGLARGRSRRRI